MIATELQDVLFGTPTPTFSEANLGVLEPNKVNIIVHGHEPLLSEMIVAAAAEPEMAELAKKAGRSGNQRGRTCAAPETRSSCATACLWPATSCSRSWPWPPGRWRP